MTMESEIAALVDEEGGTLTLGRVASGTYSPSTSSATVTPAATNVTGLILEYRAFERDGTHILAGDKKAVLKGDVSPAPKVDDTITKAGKSHKIVNVRTIENQGEVVVYVCQIRG